MEIRTFWKIVLKLAGLWLLHSCLYIIPHFFTTLALIRGNLDFGDGIYTTLALSLLVLLVYLTTVWLCLFKTGGIIRVLHLTKHFENEKIPLNFSDYKLINALVILIGGFIFVEGLPALCREVFSFFQQKLLIKDYAQTSRILYYFLSTLFGYLIMTNSRYIASFLNQKSDD